jgi:hypothetical protein
MFGTEETRNKGKYIKRGEVVPVLFLMSTMP